MTELRAEPLRLRLLKAAFVLVAFFVAMNLLARTGVMARLFPREGVEKDALDVGMMNARHPAYVGYVGRHDDLFPTSDPALAPFDHEQYTIVLRRKPNRPDYGEADVIAPGDLVKTGVEALTPTVCRLFARVRAEPRRAAYTLLHVVVSDPEGAASLEINADPRRCPT